MKHDKDKERKQTVGKTYVVRDNDGKTVVTTNQKVVAEVYADDNNKMTTV